MADARCQQTWSATSSVLALIANVNRDPKKTRPFSPNDFNPYAQRSGADEPVMQVGIEALKAVFVNRKDAR